MTRTPTPPEPGTAVVRLDSHPDFLPRGTVVDGFRLLRHVATGSYGSVWQVQSLAAPTLRFALKISLHAPGEDNPGDARALREVLLLLQVAHENVVRLVAHGRWRDPKKGSVYVVLEWVEGGTLWQWAHTARPSALQVVRLTQKLARALQRAHAAGVVHRDVKPDNVLVRAADGEPFLSDFGVGRSRWLPDLTQGALPPGTPSYQSPQLLACHLPQGAPYRAQATDDWYALGVLLYELLTQVPPYPRSHDAQELAAWVLRYKPVAPHELNPRVPPALSQVVLTLLNAEPHLRYPDGQALCAALEQALATADAPEAPLYPPLPPPELTPTRPPSTSDGPPAQDEQVRNAHVMRDEEDPEEKRLERLERQRDSLLRSPRQRRPWWVWNWAVRVTRTPLVLLGVVVALGTALAVGAWAQRRPPVPRVPLSVLMPAPQVPAPVAPSGSSTLLTPSDASPSTESSLVKSPKNSVVPASPPAPSPLRAARRGAAKAVVCLSLITASCTSVPLRPTQQQCPPAAVAAVKQRGWHKIDLDLDPNKRWARLRPGPIISISAIEPEKQFPHPPKGALLHGHVFFAEDGRVVVRYLEVELESGERVPICHAVVAGDNRTVDVPDVRSRTENMVEADSNQIANFFRVLPD
ncbi:MAG TPA: serine/threonine-protein kinase [Myxococcaceae bacterium]|nr:serine/threonine-protein kinase [Myxococcaceae bacterium]